MVSVGQSGGVWGPWAKAVAGGGRRVLGGYMAVSTTGVAGPDSDDRGNAVGLVYVAIATEQGAYVRQVRAGSGRERIRTVAAHHAFDLVRRYLTGLLSFEKESNQRKLPTA